MTFVTHIPFGVEADGKIERGEGQLPSAIRLPALSVTVAPRLVHRPQQGFCGAWLMNLKGQRYKA